MSIGRFELRIKGIIHSWAACGLYTPTASTADSSDNARSRIDNPPKSNSSWRSSAVIEPVDLVSDVVADVASCPSSLRSLLRISMGSGPVYMVLDSFNVEPLALRDDAKNEDADDSVDARDSEDDLGVMPGRC